MTISVRSRRARCANPATRPRSVPASAGDAFCADVIAGLSRPRKTLPCKWLYDERGSQLFEEICRLPEYYPTRTEIRILTQAAAEIADAAGPGCRVIEYGSGGSHKTRLLLQGLREPAGYVPVDISAEHLHAAAARLSDEFPALEIAPLAADFTGELELPPAARSAARNLLFFPGSTIGNFEPAEAEAFLSRAAATTGAGGSMLIGVDLRKDPDVLHRAYNDAAGVTAEFNRNLLRRINRELDGGFDPDAFAHYAFDEPTAGRIEMHLVGLLDQTACVAGERFDFERGESIHTECSYKYGLRDFAALAGRAGWSVDRVWTDPDGLFSVQWMTAT